MGIITRSVGRTIREAWSLIAILVTVILVFVTVKCGAPFASYHFDIKSAFNIAARHLCMSRDTEETRLLMTNALAYTGFTTESGGIQIREADDSFSIKEELRYNVDLYLYAFPVKFAYEYNGKYYLDKDFWDE